MTEKSEPRQDPEPARGTDKPWERPGQKSQNPGEKDPPRPDLDAWNKAIRR